MPDQGHERGLRDIAGLVAQASGKPDPVRWIRSRIAEALARLDDGAYDPGIKAEAKRELFEIEREILSQIGARDAKPEPGT